MNEIKSCMECSHYNHEARSPCPPCVLAYERGIPYRMQEVSLAHICKHYAAPEPSELEKAWEKFEDLIPLLDLRKDGPCYEAALVMYDAGRKVGYKKRGEDDDQAIRTNPHSDGKSWDTICKILDIIRKLDEEVDDGQEETKT